MLTQICQYLRNWFNSSLPKIVGTFEVCGGEIASTGSTVRLSDVLKDGQYFRIVGSALNDGVHQWPDSDLQDEAFKGAVWPMAVPPVIVELAGDVEMWSDKYAGPDSVAVSPFQSESFGGYSYSKGTANSSNGGFGVSWQDVFAARLAPWRKI